jgi:hypothetical protein
VLFLQDKKKERKGRQEEADRSRKGGIYTCVAWIHQRTILIAIFVTLTCMAQTKGEAKRAAVGQRHAPTRGGEPFVASAKHQPFVFVMVGDDSWCDALSSP